MTIYDLLDEALECKGLQEFIDYAESAIGKEIEYVEESGDFKLVGEGD